MTADPTPPKLPPLPEEQVGRILRGMDRLLSRVAPATVERWGVGITLAVGILDFATGHELTLHILYLPAILAAVWYGARPAGYFLAILAAGVRLCADLLERPEVPLPGTIAWNSGAILALFLGVAYLAVKLRASLENQRLLALSDPLTGVANTRAFFDRLKVEVERALRYGSVFTLVYLDLDHFKSLNDTLGHSEGNRCLLLVAETMRTSTRATDLVARLGGDEFGMLLPETPFGQAEGALNKLRGQVLDAMQSRGWPVTLSIGAVTFETPTATADDAVRIADQLMYEAKEQGGDGIRHILWTGEDAVDSAP